MSEFINNSEQRKKKLKELILALHHGRDQDSVRDELQSTLKQIPYGEVVEVEQELISEGLPIEEVLKLCDVHSAVLQGNIELNAMKSIPQGHPIDVFQHENKELLNATAEARRLLFEINQSESDHAGEKILMLRGLFNLLMDVDKHYQRKEYLLFPFLEQKGITGPPKVMWGKHDEIRGLIKGTIEILQQPGLSSEDLLAASTLVIEPALFGIEDMTKKEEQILLPMAMDKLTDSEWDEISRQSIEIGFCIYDPAFLWKSDTSQLPDASPEQLKHTGRIQLPSGSMSPEELLAILNCVPVDMTFVDKDDKVKYFSQGTERIFQRNRAILNRDVRHCHPPASAHIVDKIIDDFKSGRQNRAPFWINMKGKMIHIEYFALRNENGEYLGVLEVSQDVIRYRELQGEKRILSYT